MIGEHAVESISCFTRSRARIHVIGTSPTREQSGEFARFLEQHTETVAAMEKWERYSTIHSEDDITTDYVAVAE